MKRTYIVSVPATGQIFLILAGNLKLCQEAALSVTGAGSLSNLCIMEMPKSSDYNLNGTMDVTSKLGFMPKAMT